MYSLLGRKILLTINLRQKDLSTPLWAARVVSALEDFHSTWAGTHFAHSADLLMKSVIALVWISWADFKILDGNFSELSTSLEASAFTLVKISEALDSLLNFSSICMYLKIIKLNLFWKYFPIQKNFQCIASWLRLFYAEHSRSEWNRIISIYEYGTKDKIPLCQLHPESQAFSSLAERLRLHPKSAAGTNQGGINRSELERHECPWDNVAPRVYIAAVSSSEFLSILRPRLKVSDQVINCGNYLWNWFLAYIESYITGL